MIRESHFPQQLKHFVLQFSTQTLDEVDAYKLPEARKSGFRKLSLFPESCYNTREIFNFHRLHTLVIS